MTVVRGHPSLPSCYVVIARTAFDPSGGPRFAASLPELRLEGRVAGVVLAAAVDVPRQQVRARPPVGPLPGGGAQPELSDAAHPARALAAAAAAGGWRADDANVEPPEAFVRVRSRETASERVVGRAKRAPEVSVASESEVAWGN